MNIFSCNVIIYNGPPPSFPAAPLMDVTNTDRLTFCYLTYAHLNYFINFSDLLLAHMAKISYKSSANISLAPRPRPFTKKQGLLKLFTFLGCVDSAVT